MSVKLPLPTVDFEVYVSGSAVTVFSNRTFLPLDTYIFNGNYRNVEAVEELLIDVLDSIRALKHTNPQK